MVALHTAELCRDVAYNLRLKGGSVPVLASATPLKGQDGQLLGSVEIIRDISRLKALEQEREDFVSMLSHDLKSPITAIVGSLDLVREARLGPVNTEQKEYLESAVESCAEMTEMIDTLLDVHKFEAGKMTMKLKPEDPLGFLQKAEARYKPVASRVQLQLDLEVEQKLEPVELDRAKVTRVLANLLSNAFKFTPEGGRVSLRAIMLNEPKELVARINPNLYSAEELPTSGAFLLIEVSDSGVGIPADALETIFDRFAQAKNRRAGKTRGTGLGLAFCRKVMDAHHGYIWVESEEGRGSTFYLLFPAAGKP